MVATLLSLLARADLSKTSFNPSLIYSQLLYLVSDHAHMTAPVDNVVGGDTPTHSRPKFVSEEMYQVLASVPAPGPSLENVWRSFAHSDKWKRLLESPEALPLNELPWRQRDNADGEESAEREADEPTLTDLVLIKAVNKGSLTHYIGGAVPNNTTTALADVLGADGEAPLLLLYDEEDIVSQANMMLLEESTIFKVAINNFIHVHVTCECHMIVIQ